MNYKSILIIAFLFISKLGLSQVDAPYYYVDFNQWHDEDNTGCLPISCEFYDWNQQMTHTDRISLTEIDPYFGKSLKIRVEPQDVNICTDCTRTEIFLHQDKHVIRNNMARYYSYDLFIPDNYQFPESNPTNNGGYNILQFIENREDSHCGIGQSPILLQYVMPSTPPLPNDKKRDLRVYMGTWYGGCATDSCAVDPYFRGYRTYLIKDAIERGKWNHMVFNINWSYDGDEAYMYMNINDKHVVDDGNPSSCGLAEGRDLRIGNPGESPFKMDGVPLIYVKDNAPNKYQPRSQDLIPNYLKIGHYRYGFNTTNKFFIDNFRITHTFPPSPFKTELIPWDCNVTLKDRNSYKLNAYELDPTDLYLFQFKDQNNNYTYAGVSGDAKPEVDLLNQSWAKAGKTYDVQVRSKNDLNNGAGFPYSKVCQVTTPTITQLAESYCHNLNLRNLRVYCDPIIGATNYKFRITQGGNTYWKNTTQNYLDFNTLFGFQYNTVYGVQVSVSTPEQPNGFAYGQLCQVKFKPPFGRTSQENLDSEISTSSSFIKIFPNPTTNEINILDTENSTKEVKLYDSNGRLLLTTSETKISGLSSYQNGIYFLHILTDYGMQIKQVVKN